MNINSVNMSAMARPQVRPSLERPPINMKLVEGAQQVADLSLAKMHLNLRDKLTIAEIPPHKVDEVV